MRSGQAGPQPQPEGERIPSVCRTDGLPPALAAARSGQAGAACGESRTGSGGTSGLHAARGDSVWMNATRGRFAQRASPRGRLGLSGRGRGKAPRAAKTPSTPLPQRGPSLRPGVCSGERQQPSLPARRPGVAEARGEPGHNPGAQSSDCPAALLRRDHADGVHPVGFGSLCVVNVDSSVKSALRLSL